MRSNALYIVMEYADGGDLTNLIRKHKDDNEPFTETDAMTIFSQCLLALQYIHSKHILHRHLVMFRTVFSGPGEVTADLPTK